VLYRGYPITVFREVPFAMVQMPLYETLKAVIPLPSPLVVKGEGEGREDAQQQQRFAFVRGLAPGFISGGVSAVLTTPLDVAKTRIMTMQRVGGGGGGGAVRLARDVLCSIVKGEGWRALFKGGMTRCVWISAGGALFFGTYEGVKGALAVPL